MLWVFPLLSLTIPVVFLILLIHFLLFFIIYVGLTILIILLKEPLGVSDFGAEWRKALRRTGAVLPFHWWQHLCHSPSPPGASSLSGPEEDKHVKLLLAQLDRPQRLLGDSYLNTSLQILTLLPLK